MSHFTISGFSDEISPDIKTQFKELNRLGIGYFEIRGVNGKNVSELTEDEAKEVMSFASDYGISVSSVGSPIGKIQITDPFEEHLELLKHVIKLSKIFKTDYIRVFSFYIPKGENPADYRDEVIRRMRLMVELAQKEGVILLHENEKGIYGDTAPRCKDILDAVDSPNLMAVFDPANFVEVGQVTYPDAYNLLRDKVVYMHIKDANGMSDIVPAGYGMGHLADILASLKESDYSGFLSLEPHLSHFKGLESLQSSTKNISNMNPSMAFELAHESLLNIINNLK